MISLFLEQVPSTFVSRYLSTLDCVSPNVMLSVSTIAPPMPAMILKPVPRLFSLILFYFSGPTCVHEDVIVNTSLSSILFFDLAACSGEYSNIHYFLVHAIDGLG